MKACVFQSAALNAAALATNSSTGKSRKKSPSPEVTPQNKASPVSFHFTPLFITSSSKFLHFR